MRGQSVLALSPEVSQALQQYSSPRADPDRMNKRGQTPLSLATAKGNDVITSLLRRSEPGK